MTKLRRHACMICLNMCNFNPKMHVPSSKKSQALDMSDVCLFEALQTLEVRSYISKQMYIEFITKFQHDWTIFRLVINSCMWIKIKLRINGVFT